MKINTPERLAYLFLFTITMAGVVISFINPDYFMNHYVEEDGLIEYGTAVIFFIAASWMGVRLWKTKSAKGYWFVFTSALIIMAAIFVAGEEISWGQRLFNLTTTEYFAQHNVQSELNLHNLVVGDVKINKLIFGKLLTVLIFLYLLLVPILYQKWEKFKKFMDTRFIPISRYHHAIAYVFFSLVVLIIPQGKKWEVLEFDMALLFFMILLNPLNRKVFG